MSLTKLDSNSNDKYILSSLISGHTDDVRSLISTSNSTTNTTTTTSTTKLQLFSASRDSTARSWEREINGGGGGDDKNEWKEKEVYKDHEGFVNSIAWIEGYLITGGIDSIINIYSLDSNSTSNSTSPIQILYGHSGNICSLHSIGNRIVSGSWDGTARVWESSTELSEGNGNWEIKHILISSETRISSVWDVLILEGEMYNDSVITASADNYIRLWKGDKVDIIYKGHTQAVRALTKLTSSEGSEEPESSLFASASNDTTIRIWNLKGDQITVLEGHDSFIYSLITIPFDLNQEEGEGGLVSSGEDGIVRIWGAEDGELEQEILIPALSVWTLAISPNGDIAMGGSDNLIWIFTKDKTRAADSNTTQQYDALMALRKPIKKKSTDLLIESLSALEISGTKEGTIKLIKVEDGSTHAYSWTSGDWIDEGTVVDATNSTTTTSTNETPKMLHEGKEYDFVFQIDYKDNIPSLPLAINLNDNIEEVVEKFMEINVEVPKSYKERIEEFVKMSMN